MGHALHYLFGGLFSWIYHHVLVWIGHGFQATFGSWWPAVAVLLVVLVAVALAILVFRRRAAHVFGRRTPATVAARVHPDEYEADADAAAQRGEFSLAVRYRYLAGVLRLSEAGVIDNAAAQTDRQLLASVTLPTFVELARTHERVTYGRVPATASDDEAARRGWADVVASVRRAPELVGSH